VRTRWHCSARFTWAMPRDAGETDDGIRSATIEVLQQLKVPAT
jgi:Arc/MetJ family transcription regulator